MVSVSSNWLPSHNSWISQKVCSLIICDITKTLSFSLQVSSGHYANVIHVWERGHGQYLVTSATIRLLLSTLNSCLEITESILATAIYIIQTVFVNCQNWRYNSQKYREEFCKSLTDKMC